MTLPIPVDAGARAMFQWARDLVKELEQGKSAGAVGAGSSAGGTSQVLPAGVFLPFAGSVVPAGFLLCAGQLISNADQPNLARAVGRRFCLLGDDPDSFRLPNGAGRFFMGDDGGAALGGAADAILSLANLPAHNLAVTDPGHTHTHTQSAHSHSVTDPGHTHSVGGSPITGGGTVSVGAGSVTLQTGAVGALTLSVEATGLTVAAATSTGSNANSATGLSVALGGSGTALPILPPYFSGSWIVSL